MSNTTTVFSRDVAGKVSFGDGTTVLVPVDASALGVLSHNEFANGDVFADDHWVYRDGKRHHKWFTSTSEIKRLWPPHLKELSRIESLYQRCGKRMHDVWKCSVETAIGFYLDQGIQHADLLEDGEFLFRFAFDRNDYQRAMVYKSEFSYSITSRDVGENGHVNVEAAKRFRVIERYYMSVCYRLARVKYYLDAALKQKIGRPERDGTVFRVDVNGRSYFYRSVDNGYGYYDLQKVAWPGEDMVTVTHGGDRG